MMQMYEYPPENKWSLIVQRPVAGLKPLKKKVRKIMRNVREKGDKAILKYTRTFDGVELTSLRVSAAEMAAAGQLLPGDLKKAIDIARKNIEIFHSAQLQDTVKIETMPGVTCWRRSVAIEKIGMYIPGGSAPLFSTVLMLAVPATLAGCKEIILCTPPGKNGTIHPSILYTAEQCGIQKIFKAGGAQAIAAMAYGTESIPAVYKLFGPGNQYVTLAKQLVQQQGMAIDMPAGPSEVAIIADATAEPEYLAADLLAQAEHGPDSQVLLICTDKTIVQRTIAALQTQLNELPRKKIAQKALLHSNIVLLDDLSTAVRLSNLYAPEHLMLCCREAHAVSEQVTAAGSVFIGNHSPESAGDYASGTNHTLPTHGYANAYSGVSVDSFLKKITYQELTKEGLTNISNTIMTMAAAEGLAGHKKAVSIRLNQ